MWVAAIAAIAALIAIVVCVGKAKDPKWMWTRKDEDES